MRCTNCDEELKDGEAHFAFDEPYCEECFDNSYTYCCRCDSIVSRNDITHYSDDGDPYCSVTAGMRIMTMRHLIIQMYMMKTGILLFIYQEAGFKETMNTEGLSL